MNSKKATFTAFCVLFLFLAVLFLAAPKVSADVLIPGYKGVEYCFQIENTNDFPDYTFVVHYTFAMENYQVVRGNECMHFYKFNKPKIYAVKKSLFNEVPLISIMNSDNHSKLTEYIANDKNFISSDVEIESISQIVDTDPSKKIVDELKIISIENDMLEIEKSKTIYTYTDGTTEEKTYVTQNVRPLPSRLIIPLSSYEIMYFAIPAAALIVIIIILVARRFRKGKTEGAKNEHSV
ncbi:MAG: hypothetical protein NTU57_02025 [Candidatus Aenigmarchaeota archaeon]|nr:hypothetical protein [Candidatus Aenigmarchaeota archaeon]